jgi:hypothetical protein
VGGEMGEEALRFSEDREASSPEERRIAGICARSESQYGGAPILTLLFSPGECEHVLLPYPSGSFWILDSGLYTNCLLAWARVSASVAKEVQGGHENKGEVAQENPKKNVAQEND